MNLRNELGQEHKAINQQLSEMADAVEGAEFPTIQRVLCEVDRRLKAHFELEECHLFDKFEKDHAQEIRALRQEHEKFLATLDTLITEAELHTLRKARVDAFVDGLERHAQREDENVYQWVNELSEESQHPILGYFDRMRSLLSTKTETRDQP